MHAFTKLLCTFETKLQFFSSQYKSKGKEKVLWLMRTERNLEREEDEREQVSHYLVWLQHSESDSLFTASVERQQRMECVR